MTPREILKETLNKNQKEYKDLPDWAKNLYLPINLFPKPEQLKSVLPKLIDYKIKEHYIELDPVEWKYVTKVYL